MAQTAVRSGTPIRHRTTAGAADLAGRDRSRAERREIARPRAQLDALEVGTFHLDLDRPPGSVAALVRRHVAERVSGGNLLADLLVQRVELLRAGREERLAA